MKYNMNSGGNFVLKECKIQESGNLKCDGKDIVVEVMEKKLVTGTIKFELGKIVDVGLDYVDKYNADDVNENETVSLILEHNTTLAISWTNSSTYNFVN